MLDSKNRKLNKHKCAEGKFVYRLNIPVEWAEYLGFTSEDVDGVLELENDHLVLRKKGGVRVG